jgi:hypothetical protein
MVGSLARDLCTNYLVRELLANSRGLLVGSREMSIGKGAMAYSSEFIMLPASLLGSA